MEGMRNKIIFLIIIYRYILQFEYCIGIGFYIFIIYTILLIMRELIFWQVLDIQ